MNRHGGNLNRAAQQSGCRPEDLLDFSANINPLGFPDWLRPLISANIEKLLRYPDPEAEQLTAAIAARQQIDAAQVVVGNGASQLLAIIPRALKVDRVLLPVPCYVDYQRAAEQAGLSIETVELTAAENFVLNLGRLEAALDGTQLVIIGHPNNPTGQLVPRAELLALARKHPQQYFVIDESFIDFCGVEEFSLRWQRPANVIVVQSLTKSWGIPGARLGYLLADSDVAASVLWAATLSPDGPRGGFFRDGRPIDW